MSPNKSSLSFRAALSHLARDAARESPHPPVARLAAYHRGELAEREAGVVADHLSVCPRCTQELLELAEFLDDEGEEADAVVGERIWRAIEGEVSPAPMVAPDSLAPNLAPVVPLAPRRAAGRPVFASLPFAYGLAAVLAAALGLSLWVGRGPVSPGAGAVPRLNERSYDLSPQGAQRGEVPEQILRFSGPDGSAHLILNPATAEEAERYGVRFRAADGRVSWQGQGLEPLALGTFRVGLPRAALPAGHYTIELYGEKGGRELTLGNYRISIPE